MFFFCNNIPDCYFNTAYSIYPLMEEYEKIFLRLWNNILGCYGLSPAINPPIYIFIGLIKSIGKSVYFFLWFYNWCRIFPVPAFSEFNYMTECFCKNLYSQIRQFNNKSNIYIQFQNKTDYNKCNKQKNTRFKVTH